MINYILRETLLYDNLNSMPDNKKINLIQQNKKIIEDINKMRFKLNNTEYNTANREYKNIIRQFDIPFLRRLMLEQQIQVMTSNNYLIDFSNDDDDINLEQNILLNKLIRHDKLRNIIKYLILKKFTSKISTSDDEDNEDLLTSLKKLTSLLEKEGVKLGGADLKCKILEEFTKKITSLGNSTRTSLRGGAREDNYFNILIVTLCLQINKTDTTRCCRNILKKLNHNNEGDNIVSRMNDVLKMNSVYKVLLSSAVVYDQVDKFNEDFEKIFQKNNNLSDDVGISYLDTIVSLYNEGFDNFGSNIIEQLLMPEQNITFFLFAIRRSRSILDIKFNLYDQLINNEEFEKYVNKMSNSTKELFDKLGAKAVSKIQKNFREHAGIKKIIEEKSRSASPQPSESLRPTKSAGPTASVRPGTPLSEEDDYLFVEWENKNSNLTINNVNTAVETIENELFIKEISDPNNRIPSTQDRIKRKKELHTNAENYIKKKSESAPAAGSVFRRIPTLVSARSGSQPPAKGRHQSIDILTQEDIKDFYNWEKEKRKKKLDNENPEDITSEDITKDNVEKVIKEIVENKKPKLSTEDITKLSMHLRNVIPKYIEYKNQRYNEHSEKVSNMEELDGGGEDNNFKYYKKYLKYKTKYFELK